METRYNFSITSIFRFWMHFLAIFLLISVSTQAQRVIEVEASDNWFADITVDLVAGDTLLFVTDGGVYNSPATINLPAIPLTLMAAQGLENKPVLKTDVAGSMLRVNADFTVIGLAFDGAYAERGESGGTYRFIQPMSAFSRLEVHDSDFYNLRGFGITSAAADIDTLIINNSTFYDFNRVPVYFNDRKDLVKHVRITNSTFYDITNVGIYIWGAVHGFEVSNCTFSGINNINLYPKDIDENMVIRDNIIVSDNATGAKVYGDAPIVQYNAFHNNSLNIEYMGSGTPDFATGNVFADPMFQDASLAMFALHTDSPAIGAASDGGNMGDPRWGVYGIEDSVVVVTFSVTIPENTPVTDDIYLVGTFNSWDPGGQPMNQVDAVTWELLLSLEKNTEYSYKYTRGSWETVEKGANGEEIDNRQLITGGSAMSVEDVVASWADVPVEVVIRKMQPVLTFYDSQPQHNIAITWFSDVSGASTVHYGIDD
ncbi:MAG: right-handed parallel beta-helix repeat-containing protein, partial [Cyclonatronaceae bacterium]